MIEERILPSPTTPESPKAEQIPREESLHNDYPYFSRTEEGTQCEIYCRN